MGGVPAFALDSSMKEKTFREYGLVLRRYWLWVAAAAIVAGALTYGVLARQGTIYEAHFSYLVSLAEREVPETYAFDGYYALQSTDSFAATLARWAAATEVIVRAWQEAGLAPVPTQARVLARSVNAEKTAPQLVQITVRHRDERAARKLSEGLQAVMQRNVDNYQREGVPALKFRVVPTEMWIGRVESNPGLVAAGTAAAVIIIGFSLVLLKEAAVEL